MRAKLLYEPNSVRGDHGVLYITQGQACKIPIYVDWKGKNQDGTIYDIDIKPYQKVLVRIKENFKLQRNIVEYIYTNIRENTVILEISAEDAKLFRGDRDYLLGMVLLDSANTPLQSILRDLPIKVKGSILL